MGSPYAQNRGAGGGSPYARQRFLGDRVVSSTRPRFTGSTTPSTPPPQHHPSLFGSIRHALGAVGHYAASKSELGARDVKAIYGGTIDTVNTGVVQPYKDFVTTGHVSKKTNRSIDRAINEQSDSVEHTLKHPGDDPFATLMLLAPALHGVGRVGTGAVEAGRAVKAGEGVRGVVKAAARLPEPRPRLLRSGEAQVPLHPSRSPAVRAVQGGYDRALNRSLARHPEGRLAAHANRRIGGSLAETARFQQRMRAAVADDLEHAGRKLGSRKLAQAALRLSSENSTAEEAAAFHRAQAAKGVEPNRNSGLAKMYDRLAEKQMLVRDAHGNVAIDAARYPQLAEVDRKLAAGQTRVDSILRRYGLMTDEGLASRRDAPGRIRAGATYEQPTPGKQGVSPALVRATAERDRLAGLHERALDAETKYVAGRRSVDLRGPMSETDAKARLAELDSHYHSLVEKLIPETSNYGGKLSQREQLRRNFENAKRPRIAHQQTVKSEEFQTAEDKLLETVDKNRGNPTADAVGSIVEERQRLRDLLNGRAEAGIAGEKPPSLPKSGGQPAVPEPSNPYRNRIVRLGHAREVAQQKVDRLQAAADRRVKPTGIVGGETARPGRGFVPYKVSEPKAARSPRSASPGPVVGEARPPIGAHAFTGSGLEKGLVPDNTTGAFARHMRRGFHFVSTDQFRRAALETGAAARRSSRDVLVRVPAEKGVQQLPLEIEQALGRKHVTLDELHGHELALSAFLDRLIPGRVDGFATDRQQAIGAPAPRGYRWVDQHVLGDAASVARRGPRGKVARGADAVNSAVTAATVYFKLGHVPTRTLTNAATTIIQGAAGPLELGRSVRLWKALPWQDRLRALAASGQHGYAALPHEGESLAGRAASTGARWFARHIDAPFRFASIAYEARRAGYRTAADFRTLLDQLEHPDKLTPDQRARVLFVAKEANRAGIAYDRLNPAEQHFVARAVWFYPWIKGATVFAGRTILEHPYKSAALVRAGVHGRQLQEQQLGDLPSYEQGLFRLAGGKRPLVADFSTFSPFATPADVVEAGARPGELSGFLNPLAGAAVDLGTGRNQYGGPSTSPLRDAGAELLSPTPEAQILAAYLQRHSDQSRRMFRKTPGSALARALVGPGLPRRVNLKAAHAAAARERAGR